MSEFKVGDRVRVVSCGGTHSEDCSRGCDGELGYIREFNEDREFPYEIEFDEGNDLYHEGFKASELGLMARCVLKDEPQKFKVGDRVRITACAECNNNGDCVGVEATLSDVSLRGNCWIENSSGDTCVSVYYPSELELVDSSGERGLGTRVSSDKQGSPIMTAQSFGVQTVEVSLEPGGWVTTSSTTNPINIKEGIMSKLSNVPKQLKRFLNANYKAFYQLDWVDEDLQLSEDGESALVEFLFSHFEKEFGSHAQAEVKRIEDEEKKNKK